MVNVSVIIPNYNYARFLQRRIDSIALQTIRPAEIIFLDDCSTDNSLEIAPSLLNKYDIPYKIIPNKTNQGVFKQWWKGIALAEYDYVWIAEADDACELNLLETLLPAFDDKAVILSYCQSKIMDADGQHLGNFRDAHLAQHIDVSRWQSDYTNNCLDEASNYLSITCTITNASAVVLSKKHLPLEKLTSVLDYKMAGDWFFYLITLFENPHLKIAYCSASLNYWCKHSGSVWGDPSRTLAGKIEFLTIYKILLESYQVSKPAKIEIFNLLNKHFCLFLDKDYIELLFSVFKLLNADTDDLAIKTFVNYKSYAEPELARLYRECAYRDSEIKTLKQIVKKNLLSSIFGKYLFSKLMRKKKSASEL